MYYVKKWITNPNTVSGPLRGLFRELFERYEPDKILILEEGWGAVPHNGEADERTILYIRTKEGSTIKYGPGLLKYESTIQGLGNWRPKGERLVNTIWFWYSVPDGWTKTLDLWYRRKEPDIAVYEAPERKIVRHIATIHVGGRILIRGRQEDVDRIFRWTDFEPSERVRKTWQSVEKILLFNWRLIREPVNLGGLILAWNEWGEFTVATDKKVLFKADVDGIFLWDVNVNDLFHMRLLADYIVPFEGYDVMEVL